MSKDLDESNTNFNDASTSNKNALKSDNKNSSFDILACGSINKDYVLTYSKLEIDTIEQEVKSRCKILKFSSEWSYDEVLLEISKLDNKLYQNLFIFIFELDKISIIGNRKKRRHKNNIKSLFQHLLHFGDKRPLILQVTSITENSTKIFCKKEEDVQFETINYQLNNPKHVENFNSFLHFLRDSKSEDFENTIIEKLRFGKSSPLIIRFLKTIELSDEFFTNLALKCGSQGSKNDLLAVLDIPFQYEAGKIESISSKWLEIVFEVKKEEKSILLNAVEQSNNEVINFLLEECGHLIENLPCNHQYKISTTAFIKDQTDILCDFLELCEFPFPKNFDPRIIKNKRLAEISKKREELHGAIKKGEQNKINKFIISNPTIKIAFNASNNSAIYQALHFRKFKILCQLKTNGFQFIEFDDISEYIEEYNKDPNDLEIIKMYAIDQRRENVNSALPNEEKSINLMSVKSFIHNKYISKTTRKEYQEKIRHWYKEIHEMEENGLLIDIAATCDELKLIYDFESENTEKIDLITKNTAGLAFLGSKWIMIGAKLSSEKKKRENQIKGVLAHEISHYVMKMVFQNKEKPYFREDKKTAKIFTEITEEIRILSTASDDECNGIISTVFTHYPPKNHQAELIVRFFHIIAEFGTDEVKLAYLKKKYELLFDFVRDFVLPEMKKFLTGNREKVRSFNINANIFSEVKKLDYDFFDVKDVSFTTENQLTILKTNQPKLLLLKIIKDLEIKYGNLMNVKNIFIDLKKFNDSKELIDIMSNNQNLNIFVDCSMGISESLNHIADHDKTNFIFIVSNENDNEKLNQMVTEFKLSSSLHSVDFTWKNLDEKSQRKLLQTKINIRKHQTTLLDLLTRSDKSLLKQETSPDFSEIVDDQLLNMLINQSEISINTDSGRKSTEKEFEVSFMSRSFIKKVFESSQICNLESKEEDETTHLDSNESPEEPSAKNVKQIYKLKKVIENITEEEVLKDVENKKYVLLSDLAGSGKTWAVQNFVCILGDEYISNWISKIDLKEFIKVFKVNQKTSPDFASFIIEKLLRAKQNFEAQIFKRMYEIGKVQLFFDGFDEIAPDYTDFITKLMKSLMHNGGNQLWIVTRDYFELDLIRNMDIPLVYKLQPFTEEDGINLITSNWILSDLGENVYKQTRKEIKKIIQNKQNYKKYREKATHLSTQIAHIMENSSIGIPQFYKIIVSIMKNTKEGIFGFTIPKIYEKFIEIQLLKWSYEKGELRKKANLKIQFQCALNFIGLHMYFAIRSLYPEFNVFCGLKFNSIHWSDEEIIACGLMNKISGMFFFIHETFREYFAAQFIIRSLESGDELDDENFCKFFIDFLTIQKFGIIRIFLDEAFEEDSIMEEIELIAPDLANFLFQNVFNFDSLSEIFEKNLRNVISVIEKIFKVGKYEDVKRILFNSIDTLFQAAEFNEKFDKFLEFIFLFLKKSDAKELMMQVDYRQDNCVHFLMSNTPETIEKAFEVLKKNLNSTQYLEIIKSIGSLGRNLLQTAIKRSKNFKTFEIIWKFFQNIYKSTDEFLNFLSNVDNYQSNSYQIIAAFGSNEVFNCVIDELEKIASHDKIKNILSTLGYRQKNLLQTSARQNESVELQESLWNTFKKYFNISEIIEFIVDTDSDGNNIFFCIYSNLYHDVAEILWKMIRTSFQISCTESLNIKINECDIFITEFLKDMGDEHLKLNLMWKLKELEDVLKLENSYRSYQKVLSDGKFPIDCKDIHRIAILTELELHQKFWNFLMQNCKNVKILFDTLLEKDTLGNNYIHLIIATNNTDIIKYTILKLKDNFNDTQLKEILKSKGKGGRNLLQSAVFGSKDIETHQFLWKFLKDIYKTENEFLELFKEKDSLNRNILHIAIDYSTSEIFGFLIEELEKVASDNDIRKLLCSKGDNRGNLLHTATWKNKTLKLHDSLWRTIQKYCNESEILEMINYCDINEFTILHSVVFWNIKEIVEYTWEKIKSFMTDSDDQMDYLLKDVYYGNDLYVCALKNQSKDPEVKIWVENFEIFSTQNYSL